jgi:Flp pilus assembly protein TadG
MIRPRPARARPRRAAAAVELAVVLPVLLILTLGTIEVTRAVQVKNYLTDATRSACRLAIQPGTATAAVKANLKTTLANYGIADTLTTPTILVNGKNVDVATAVRDDAITVSVSVKISDVGWISPYLLPSVALESETLVMMRQEH